MRRAKGSLESEVLAALWAAERPLTAGDVAAALDGDLAYTTVQTILVRLHGKGGHGSRPETTVGCPFEDTPVG